MLRGDLLARGHLFVAPRDSVGCGTRRPRALVPPSLNHLRRGVRFEKRTPRRASRKPASARPPSRGGGTLPHHSAPSHCGPQSLSDFSIFFHHGIFLSAPCVA